MPSPLQSSTMAAVDAEEDGGGYLVQGSALTSALTARRWRPRSHRTWLSMTRAQGTSVCLPRTASFPSCSASWMAALPAWPSSQVSRQHPAPLSAGWGVGLLYLLCSPPNPETSVCRAVRSQQLWSSQTPSCLPLGPHTSPPSNRGPTLPLACEEADGRNPQNTTCVWGWGMGSGLLCWKPPPGPGEEAKATFWKPQSEQNWYQTRRAPENPS